MNDENQKDLNIPQTQPLASSQNPIQPTQSVEETSPPASPNLTPSQSPGTVTISENKGRGFSVFVFFGVLLILAVWGIVGYLYFQNQKMKTPSEPTNTTASLPTSTPTPSFAKDQAKIKNGSVVREIPGSDTQTLINKEDFNSTGITGFARVVVSPDDSKLCFESWPPAPEPALYYANLNGSGVVEVSPNRQNCLWSSDSKKLFYLNSSSASSGTNIYTYTLELSEEEELTSSSVETGVIRRFELVGLSADETKVICSYEDVATEAVGECEIDIESKEVTYL